MTNPTKQKIIQTKPVNVICMKWGDKFPPDYVNRLYGMVNRHITLPFRLICFTDNPEGIRQEVEIQELPALNLPQHIPERGWKKLLVFDDHFGGITGDILFLDLDVVIVDNIDCFFSYSGKFLIAHDKKRPKKIEGNSSVFRFTVGEHSDILRFFESNIETIRKQVRHEQAYLSREIHRKGELNFWPDEWVPSFKYKCAPNWFLSWFKAPSIPNNAKIILFHGLPNPPEAIKGVSGKWYRHIQPSPWIKKYWYE